MVNHDDTKGHEANGPGQSSNLQAIGIHNFFKQSDQFSLCLRASVVTLPGYASPSSSAIFSTIAFGSAIR
ncbi:MAG: hypothetical protein DWQ34_23205, partial [Planctomycetota bacterium]